MVKIAFVASAACLSNGATVVCRPGPGPHELLNRYFQNPYGKPVQRHYEKREVYRYDNR
jgi:hypothetical protein